MKALSETGILKRYQERPSDIMLGEEECDCGEIVKLVETTLVLGPSAGKRVIAKRGCKCDDLRLAQELRERNVKRVSEIRLKKVNRLFNQYSLINNKLQRQATFKNFETVTANQHQALKSVVDFTKGVLNNATPRTLVLHGAYGTGKSHLSYAATRYLLNNQKSVLFISLPKLLTKFKSTYSDQSMVTEDQILNYLRTVDLLVLDDVGAEATSDWVKSRLFELLDDRIGKNNIVTTNYALEDLPNQIGGRNFSRLMDDATLLEFNGSDYRLKKFEKQN